MQLIIKDNYKELSKEAAKIVIEQIKSKPNSVIGFATGDTPLGLYKELIKAHKNGLDFSQIITFNLDEYLGLPDSHGQSYNYYMWDKLFNHINIKKENVNIPDGTAFDPEKFCEEYEAKIKKSGGIDLQILGIGRNGHIGFNESGSKFNSRTRIVNLTKQTRKDNAKFFEDINNVPVQAITIGISTILKSKKIILLANGKEKAENIRKLMNESKTEKFPASALKDHPNTIILVDKDAASLLD